MTVTRTFTEALTDAHRRGDEDEINALLDMQIAVKQELRERIGQANDAAANFAHQLHQISVLLDSAKENDMSVADGNAVLLRGIGVATAALQEWADR